MTDLDPAAIMAEHEAWPYGGRTHCVACGPAFDHPCLPYRLAAALVEAQEREQRVRDLRVHENILLSTTLVEAQEARADAWDEGFDKAGRLLLGMDKEDWPPAPNPYRAALDGTP